MRPAVAAVAACVVAAAALVACTRSGDEPPEVPSPSSFPPDDSSGDPAEDPERPRGGVARVGLWAEPDLAAPHLGGAAVRSLVYPQLFVAGASGRWLPSLVQPGSDRSAPDRRSASFALRDGAVWSDGSPITAADLRRSADRRFVSGVRAESEEGDDRIVVTFTQPLPGWRRLWSFTDVVTPPRDGLWGGPFTLASYTHGLEAVLRPNEAWWGTGPFLEELHLVLVPDSNTARDLLARGELDVVMPPAATARIRQLETIDGVEVASADRSGWWTGMYLNRDRLELSERLAMMEIVDRELFVGTLLKGEATVLHGFAGPEDAVWASVGPASGQGLPPGSEEVDFVGLIEEPMTPLLQRAMQRRARDVSARLELRNAEIDRAVLWVASGDYDAAVMMEVDPPEPCWTCRWAGTNEELARRADAGDLEAAVALEEQLRDERVLLPLWRHRVAFAWDTNLNGIAVNGYALSGAWNAWQWWY